MERNLRSPTKTPRDKYTPSPRPFIHLKRRFNSPHSSPFTPPSSPKYRISWFHGRIASRNGDEITKAAAAHMSRRQLVDADWEKQRRELLEVAAEANACLEEKRIEISHDVHSPYDPNSEASKPIPTWILFPKTPKIRRHAHSPLHQTAKSSASQIRKNLTRSPSRRRRKAPVSEETQTPNNTTPIRSINWKITPIDFTAGNKLDDLERELRTNQATVRELSERLEDALSRNRELESAVRPPTNEDHITINSDRIPNSFFKDSLIWSWKLIPQTSRCYIIFHVLCFCATKLRPD
ncbi:hypothetical protein BLS_003435 [Venturia inaequalis]|uniref:Uncharacterized protein n=1 Tax=Venturia inaequalis TaxID=5025 RepID=A0A8H3YVV0_VENIN|nr:hypothetical protein EG328_011593 [Venturia inaequalis]KAE9969516.1 hypothetical protein EG327_010624 [Venturia inaequalis]KAE9973793.1 hypothetical protein BLS_003435 [Venturia inaequalis]